MQGVALLWGTLQALKAGVRQAVSTGLVWVLVLLW